MSEVLSREYPKAVIPIGTPDIFSESGSPEELAEKYKLNSKGIEEKVLKALK